MVKTTQAPKVASHAVQKSKAISKAIGETNRSGRLQQTIAYKEVAGVLEAIGEQKACVLLSQLMQEGRKIEDPTEWLRKATGNRALLAKLPKIAAPRQGGNAVNGTQAGHPISKTIGALNRMGILQQPISHKDVAGPLEALGEERATQLLTQLAQQGSSVSDPTSWLLGQAAGRQGGGQRGGNAQLDAIQKLQQMLGGGGGGGGGGAALASLLSGGGGAGGLASLLSAGGGGGEAGALASLRSGGGGDAGSTSVSKAIGMLNKQGKLQEPIRFKDVAPHLSSVSESHGIDLVRQLGAKAAEVKDPTNWLIAAAKKAKTNGKRR